MAITCVLMVRNHEGSDVRGQLSRDFVETVEMFGPDSSKTGRQDDATLLYRPDRLEVDG